MNHPVHILDDKGKFLPTALIPFCEFGGSMSKMGVKVEMFDVPVCNSFQPVIIGDQLCYQVDPNLYRNFQKDNEGLTLALFISYNEDRYFSMKENDTDETYDIQNPHIIIESIGSGRFLFLFCN